MSNVPKADSYLERQEHGSTLSEFIQSFEEQYNISIQELIDLAKTNAATTKKSTMSSEIQEKLDILKKQDDQLRDALDEELKFLGNDDPQELAGTNKEVTVDDALKSPEASDDSESDASDESESESESEDESESEGFDESEDEEEVPKETGTYAFESKPEALDDSESEASDVSESKDESESEGSDDSEDEEYVEETCTDALNQLEPESDAADESVEEEEEEDEDSDDSDDSDDSEEEEAEGSTAQAPAEKANSSTTTTDQNIGELSDMEVAGLVLLGILMILLMVFF
ncbi:RNA polymerase sigma factor RpoD [Caenorhabditis elegans]|uniref:RNA polymerase sigma factor RpoD n=1 Tax=Caenorhabditis elegans TaxID=6239 RepID=Q9NEN0_CAEEL|nr:RNA polymerase sigma factor RpoD [Caenorhabditis elegans]CAB82002.1 RNA polymerase sigma factor RpoD [Caenorhabditis elegans]|eukprot:NP_493439.1 Uncharacterized protein CELE_Y71A12B.11 [Caenorhabditis elegans]